jgi:hypothetical protein
MPLVDRPRREADVAARWVKRASPADDYLPPLDPPAEAAGLPAPSTPAQAADLLAFSSDEGLTVAEPARPFGERLTVKPTEADGRIATVIGRLTPEEFGRARWAKQIDVAGNFFVKHAMEMPKAVRDRRGRMARVNVPPTLEEYRQLEEKRWQAEEQAQRMRLERVSADQRVRDPRPLSPLSRRFESRTANWRRSDCLALAMIDEYGDYEREVDEDLLLPADDLYDEYDYVVASEPTDEEEDRAREAMYGLPPGHFAREEKSRHDAALLEEARERDRREADLLARKWQDEIEQRRQDGDARFASDPRERCQNPNGCDQPVKGRGTRCSACYKYRSEHRGEERPTRLMNRQRRRRAS